MISKFTKVKKIKINTYAVFNSLTMQLVFLNHKELKLLIKEKFDQLNNINKLKEFGIVINDQNDDEIAFDKLRTAIINHSKKIRIMYLILTTNCNLACKYCFVENNPNNTKCREIMTEETCTIAISKFLNEVKNCIDEAQIIFYGGEPLINNNLLSKAIKMIRNYSQSLKVTVLTNGTLLTKEICEFFKNNNVGVGLSLDGPKKINDKNRIFKYSNESVYNVVKDKIKLLNETNCPYCVSATATKAVVNHGHKVLKDFKELGINNVFWNLFHFSKQDSHADKFYKKMSKFILKSYDRLNKLNIKEGRILDHINLFIDNIFKFQSCGAVGLNQITVQPNGDVCICQGDQRSKDNVCGNINISSIPDILNNPINDKWNHMYTIQNQECQNCEALFVCGGGCPLQALVLEGDQQKLDKTSCIFYKKLVDWLIKKCYKVYISEVKNDNS